MTINVGSVAVSVVPSAEGFNEKMRADIGDVPDISVRVVLDTADAEGKLEGIKARLDDIRDKTVRVHVDDDGSARNAAAGIDSIGLSGIGSASRVAAMATAIVTSVAAIIPIAGAASAAIAGIGGGLIAGAAGILVGGLALNGVGAALSAANTPSTGGGGGSSPAKQASTAANDADEEAQRQEQIISATNSHKQAVEALATAERDAKQAETDLTAARQAALQNLQDMTNEVADNSLAQRQAVLDLHTALTNLQTAQAAPNANAPQYADQLAGYQLAYDQAKQNLTELQEKGATLNTQNQAAIAAGVGGSQQVIDAQNKVHDSAEAVQQAQFQVADTARQVGLANEKAAATADSVAAASAAAAGGTSAYQQALAKLNPVQQQFVGFLEQIKPAFDQLSLAASASFLPPLETAISNLLPILPSVAALIRSVGSALGQVAIDASQLLSGPFGQQFIAFLTQTLGPDLITMGRILGSVFTAGVSAFEAFAPLIKTVGDDVVKLFSGIASSIQGGALTGFIKSVTADLPEVGSTLKSVLGAVTSVISALSPAAKPALAIISTLADELATLAPILSPLISAFLSLVEQAIKPLAPVLTTLVKALVPPLIQLFHDLSPIITIVGTVFADFLEALAPLLPVIGELADELLPPLAAVLETLLTAGIAPVAIALADALIPVLPLFTAGLNQIVQAITPLIPLFAQALVQIIEQSIPLLPQIINSGIQLAVALTRMSIAILPLIPPLTELLLKLLVPAAIPVVTSFADALTVFADAALDVDNAVKGLPGFLSSVFDKLKKLLSTVKDDIRNSWNAIWDGLASVASSAFSGITDAIRVTLNGVIATVNQAIRGINDAIQAANDFSPFANIPKIPTVSSIAGPPPVLPAGTNPTTLGIHPGSHATGGLLQPGWNIINEVGPEPIFFDPGRGTADVMTNQQYRQLQPGVESKSGKHVTQHFTLPMTDPVAIAHAVNRRIQFV